MLINLFKLRLSEDHKPDHVEIMADRPQPVPWYFTNMQRVLDQSLIYFAIHPQLHQCVTKIARSVHITWIVKIRCQSIFERRHNSKLIGLTLSICEMISKVNVQIGSARGM